MGAIAEHRSCHDIAYGPMKGSEASASYRANAWFPGLGAPKVNTLRRWNLKVLLMSYAASNANAPPRE